MTPYGSFLFFFILGILFIPVIVLGLNGKKSRIYNAVLTIVMLLIIFADNYIGWLHFLLFIVWQILLIQGYIHYRKKANAGFIFCLAVIASLLPLAIAKITPFFHVSLLGFLGISYLTFKGVQIILETRDGLIKKTLPITTLIYFLVFFPTISSGPIDRWRRFEKEYNQTLDKEAYAVMLYKGIHKIFIGFFYKFIVGYVIHHYAIDSIPPEHPMMILKIAYMYSYSLYLFFDFAGYSAFAIGVSYILSVKTPENFNKPFISRNIKDFWNRWHMTLSYWFRDYIYMRFLFWMTKKKWIKNRYTNSNIGYLLLFLTMGVWHGLALNYIIYGLYHAALIIGFDYFDRWNKKKKFWPDNKVTNVISIIVTFHFVCFGFWIFSGKYLFF